MKKLIILSLLILWCGALDGTMDTVKFHFDSSVFTIDNPTTDAQLWWNSFGNSESWRMRYVNGDPDQGVKWWLKPPLNFIPYDLWHWVKTFLLMSLFFTMWYIMRFTARIGIIYKVFDKKALTLGDKIIFVESDKWWFALSFMLGAWILYGGMHELMFEILLKK